MTDAATEPYLSVVVTTRNDDHGGDLNRRTQLFVDGLAAQAERHRLPTELVVVEWNPPPDRPPLADALTWPEAGAYFETRIITVPSELHRRLQHSDRLPLFQMIAKNVGIRRARGRFVLATNVDLLFSDGLMSFIAARQLEPATIYRVDRYDTEATIEIGAPISEQLRAAEAGVIRICRRDGTLDLRDGTFYRIYDSLYYLPWWIGLPIRAVRDASRLAPRAPLRLTRLTIHAPQRLRRAVSKRRGGVSRPGRLGRLLAQLDRRPLRPLRYGLLALLLSVTVMRLSWERTVNRVRILWRQLIVERARVKLHTNASGDFELLARADWHRTRGYAELEMYSMHLDSLHMYMAHWSGIRERFVDHKVFHLEHEDGFKPDPAGAQRLNDRLLRDAVQQISNEQLFDWIVEMARTRRPLDFNDDRWGLVDEELPEISIHDHAHASVSP